MSQLGNLSPKVWGHAGWKFLFSIASVYSKESAPLNIKRHYYQYLTSLKNVLPCQTCRRHYDEYLKNKPLAFYLENRETLFQWLLGLHNKSNSDNMLLSSEAAISYYVRDKNHYPKINVNAQQQQQQCTSCNKNQVNKYH